MKLFKYLFVVVLAALLFVGCEDRNDLTGPQTPETGDADFTTFVALGNSLTAGFQSGALYESAQMYSMPRLIADQVMTEFVQPIISEPGIGGKLMVESLIINNGSIAGITTTSNAADAGVPLNLDYGAAYNNLGVPGAVLFDMRDETDFSDKSNLRSNPFFSVILRNPALGASPVKQAIGKGATFVTLWIGNNDVLGYATSGGTNATGITPAAYFDAEYKQVCKDLNDAGIKAAVATIPDVSVIAALKTVGPSLAQSLSGNGVQAVYYTKGDGTIGTATISELVAGKILISLSQQAYVAMAGDQTGAYYSATGATPGADVNTAFPFGLHPSNPFPNSMILDEDEVANVKAAVQNFNTSIKEAASTYGFAVADVNAEFNEIAANGKTYNGRTFSTTYLSGGLFSLDGAHPTNQGNAVVANLFIRAINSTYNATIPEINVNSIPNSIELVEK